MWEGKTGRIQSFNQAKKFTIMKKGTCNFHCLLVDVRVEHHLKHFSFLNGKF